MPPHCRARLIAVWLGIAAATSAPPVCGDRTGSRADGDVLGRVRAERTVQLERALLSVAGYAADPDNSTLPWSESYMLQAMASAYAATGDFRYAGALIQRFEAICADRDDRRRPPRRDEMTGRTAPAWGTTRYTQGRWHVWAVHTGMICLGPAELINLLRRRPAPSIDRDRIQSMLAAIEDAVACHDPDWRWGPRKDEGYYVDAGIGLLPLNQQNALGLVLLELHKITGKPVYRDRVSALARFYRNRMRVEPNGAYTWSYQPGIEGTRPGYEDISHAAINVQFAVRCAEARIVFGRQDLRRLARTYRELVRRDKGTWSDVVGPSSRVNTYVPQAIGRWLPLAPYEPLLLMDAAEALPPLTPTSGATDFLGVANILRHIRPPRRG